ncbi:thioesterase II family protein [Microbulbifer taiwanensis]|uniref:thioesterase II family protein n=1 Tax=Microbulbifer taiwanensis TaxID=986746 RepID=UPI003622E001
MFNKKNGPYKKLFCFPYAGGNASTFASWHNSLPGHVSVLGLQFPGRAGRIAEVPIDDMEELTTIVADNMCALIDDDYIMLGHSLGARVAFEVALKLVRKGFPGPKDFIASASPAPSVKRKDAPIYDLPETEFLEALRNMGGTPEIVLQNEELKTIFIPALRADFKLVDSYQQSLSKLNSRAHVFYGTGDHTVPLKDAKAWDLHFTRNCTLNAVDGNHFFIDSNKEKVLSLVADIIG